MPKLFLAVSCAATLAAVASATAQDWPTRPLSMVVPVAAGGGTDVFGRILAPRLSEILGQQVVIENVNVAALAASRVARAQPDGYRFALGTAATHAYSPTLYKNPLYDAVADFEPVVLIAEQPLTLVARNDFPANNLKEFTLYVKANEAQIKFGSGAGVGSANHLVCELLNSAIGVRPIHVPYRIDYQCPLPTTMIPLIETNQVKGIAFLGKERLTSLPNLPTAQEQGLANFEGVTWDAFFFPKGTPAPIVQKLRAATVGAMETPSIQQRLSVIGATVVAPERRTSEYLRKFVRSEIDKWAGPIGASGASLD
jgi:tripartite-type tricarboxylate transporter receptor subunit TctC